MQKNTENTALSASTSRYEIMPKFGTEGYVCFLMNSFASKRFSKCFCFVCSFVFVVLVLFVFLSCATLLDPYPLTNSSHMPPSSPMKIPTTTWHALFSGL